MAMRRVKNLGQVVLGWGGWLEELSQRDTGRQLGLLLAKNGANITPTNHSAWRPEVAMRLIARVFE